MYENMSALSEKLDPNENDQLGDVLEKLSKTMAHIVLEGEAMEILDGDVVHSPILWLKAVLNHVEDSEKIRIFKVSALGAQSSGKSTLLKHSFWSEFSRQQWQMYKGSLYAVTEDR